MKTKKEAERLVQQWAIADLKLLALWTGKLAQLQNAMNNQAKAHRAKTMVQFETLTKCIEEFCARTEGIK